MAELTLKMASQLIGYTNADIKIPVSDDITPEEVARLHWDWNMRFLLEQEKVANEPVTEKQEANIHKAAVEVLTEKLPATKVAEEKTEHKVGGTVEVAGMTFTKHSEAPWENKLEATAEKPWQQKPKFDNLFG
jgi:hypothetical protein